MGAGKSKIRVGQQAGNSRRSYCDSLKFKICVEAKLLLLGKVFTFNHMLKKYLVL